MARLALQQLYDSTNILLVCWKIGLVILILGAIFQVQFSHFLSWGYTISKLYHSKVAFSPSYTLERYLPAHHLTFSVFPAFQVQLKQHE